MDFALLDKESEDLIKKLNEYKKDYVTVSYKDCTIATINHLIDNNYLRTAVGSFPFQNFKSDWSGVFNVTYKSRSYFFQKKIIIVKWVLENIIPYISLIFSTIALIKEVD